MQGALGYEDAFAFVDELLLVVNLGEGSASDDHPMLAPVVVILKAQTRARLYHNAFYLEAVPLIQYLVHPPGPDVDRSLCSLAFSFSFSLETTSRTPWELPF